MVSVKDCSVATCGESAMLPTLASISGCVN